jgi:hypothetical protein
LSFDLEEIGTGIGNATEEGRKTGDHHPLAVPDSGI